MLKRLALGLVVSGLIGVTSANALCCGGNWCDGYKGRGTPTLHHQGGMVTSLHGGMMLSYQAPGHALHCGSYVEEGLLAEK